jgi:hypothetical protein
MKKQFSLLIFIFCLNSVFADSPLTSSYFYKAYKDVPEVLEASKSNGVLTNTFFLFLNSNEKKIDEKIALINALKWNFKGKNNSQIYINKLFALNKKYTSSNFYFKASADELICYAYIKAMDNYFDVRKALVFSNKAVEKKPKSLTINIIQRLIKAQKMMEYPDDWCYIYISISSAIRNNALNNDFRQEAIFIISKYIEIYKRKCD